MSLTVTTDAATYTWNPEDTFVIRHQHGGGSMAITGPETEDLHGAANTIDRWVSLMGEHKRVFCGSL